MFNIFFKIITNGVTDGLSLLVYFKELKKNYCKYHCYYLLTDRITDGLFDGYMSNSLKEILTGKKTHR